MPTATPKGFWPIADSSDVSSLERVADVLGRHGVEFIVVGGQAALLHGRPCVTYDIGDLHLKTISPSTT